MASFDDNDHSEWLIQHSPEARSLKATDSSRFDGIIMSADGRLGLAKNLINKRLSDNNEEERSEIIKLIRSMGQKGSYADIHSVICAFPNKRVELSLTLERLMNALRDLIVIKYDESAKTVFFPTSDAAIKACGEISAKRLVALYDAVNEAHELCARNANVSNLIASLSSNVRLAQMK